MMSSVSRKSFSPAVLSIQSVGSPSLLHFTVRGHRSPLICVSATKRRFANSQQYRALMTSSAARLAAFLAPAQYFIFTFPFVKQNLSSTIAHDHRSFAGSAYASYRSEVYVPALSRLHK